MSNWISKQVIQTGWGSGTPWGADTQIQFNDWGAFGWDARFYFDKATWGATWGDFEVVAWDSTDWYWAWLYVQGGRPWAWWIVQAYAWNAIATDSNWWDFEFTAWTADWEWAWGRVKFTAWGSPLWVGWDVEFQAWNGGDTKWKYLFRKTDETFAWDFNFENLTTNQTYTLQDWSWTLAFLSQIGKDEFWLTVDWAGAVVTTGSKWFRYMWYDGTITGWNVTSDVSWSIVFDIKRSGVSIAGTEKPTLSSQSSNSDLTLTTWTTAITAWDELEFIVDSASTVTRATLTILITKAP